MSNCEQNYFVNVAKKLLLTGAAFICVEGVYIALVSEKYGEMVVNIQGGQPMKIRYTPATLVFLIASISYHIFIRKKDPFWKAGLLGASMYGFSEMNQCALFNKYDPSFAVITAAWGFVAFGSVHTIVQNIMIKI
jgi:hypothetical protein